MGNLLVKASSLRGEPWNLVHLIAQVYDASMQARFDLEDDESEEAELRIAAIEAAEEVEPDDWRAPDFTDYESVEVVFSCPAKIMAIINSPDLKEKLASYRKLHGEEHCLSLPTEPEHTVMNATSFDAFVLRQVLSQLEAL